MRKVLFVATITKHIIGLHTPYLRRKSKSYILRNFIIVLNEKYWIIIFTKWKDMKKDEYTNGSTFHKNT